MREGERLRGSGSSRDPFQLRDLRAKLAEKSLSGEHAYPGLRERQVNRPDRRVREHRRGRIEVGLGVDRVTGVPLDDGEPP